MLQLRPVLSERHRVLFSTLDAEEVSYVWDRVTRKWRQETRAITPPDDSLGLFEACRDVGLDHARVVLSFAGENGRARPIIEKLIGHPILNWSESVMAAQLASGVARPGGKVRVGVDGGEGSEATLAAPIRMDNRLVATVAANPHHEGSIAWTMYGFWVAGETVHSCREQGLNARSARRDVKDGHVVLEGVR